MALFLPRDFVRVAMESASRAMGDIFRELFEPDWAGRDEVSGALDVSFEVGVVT